MFRTLKFYLYGQTFSRIIPVYIFMTIWGTLDFNCLPSRFHYILLWLSGVCSHCVICKTTGEQFCKNIHRKKFLSSKSSLQIERKIAFLISSARQGQETIINFIISQAQHLPAWREYCYIITWGIRTLIHASYSRQIDMIMVMISCKY